jgi:hypothetical protein
MRMPPEFWIWAAWKDKGGIGSLPKEVARWYNRRKLIKAPPAWQIRYALHQGRKNLIHPPAPKNIYNYVAFTGWDPATAFRLPTRYTVALSADPAYRGKITKELVAGLRERGYPVVSWADCNKTHAKAAKALMAEFQLDGWIGQMEVVSEAYQCLDEGAKVVVGNANEIADKDPQLFSKIIELVAGKQLIFSQECYWGDGSQAPSEMSARGVNVITLCLGVYSQTLRLRAYFWDMPSLRVSPFWLYLCEGMLEEDWAAMPS